MSIEILIEYNREELDDISHAIFYLLQRLNEKERRWDHGSLILKHVPTSTITKGQWDWKEMQEASFTFARGDGPKIEWEITSYDFDHFFAISSEYDRRLINILKQKGLTEDEIRFPKGVVGTVYRGIVVEIDEKIFLRVKEGVVPRYDLKKVGVWLLWGKTWYEWQVQNIVKIV